MSTLQVVAEFLADVFKKAQNVNISTQLGEQLLEFPDESYVIDYEIMWKGIGIPRQPYYIELALSLIKWNETNSLDYLNLNNFEGLNHDFKLMEELQNSHYSVLHDCFTNHWPPISETSISESWINFIKVILEKF